MELEKSPSKDKKQNQKSFKKKTLQCEVISAKMNKSLSVQATHLVKHKRYGKYIRRRSVFKVHDEKNEAQTGDIVLIVSQKPISKTKRWALKKIIRPSKLRQASEMALEKEITSHTENKKEKKVHPKKEEPREEEPKK